MFVGTGYIKIRIYEAYSLKDRRQVLNSITTKLGNKFNISIAVLDKGELWNIAELGVASVSASTKMLDSVYQKIEDILDDDYRFEVVCFEVEMHKEIQG